MLSTLLQSAHTRLVQAPVFRTRQIKTIPINNPTTRHKRTSLLATSMLTISLIGCDGSTSDDEQLTQNSTPETTTTEETAEDTVTSLIPESLESDSPFPIGQIRTIEVAGVSFSSLPDTTISGTTASQELGRLLFWDPILSGDMDIACGTCHLPEFGYADGRARSIGTGGVGTGPARVAGQLDLTPRSAPSVLNTAWNGINEFGVFNPDTAPMFWDNRTRSLASQAIEPIHSLEEMRGPNFSDDEIDAEVINRLSNNSEYQQLFTQAFGNGNITTTQIGQALADFQSTLIANNSPFDRWMRGDDNAMSPQQLNGMQVFAETGCAACHSGPMFSDFDTHVLGVREANGLATPDTGDGNFAFRTPTLRQLAFTAPYFHGGQENDLDDVIDFYDNPNNSENPNVGRNQLDPDFLALPNINNNESNAIENFLDALNDNDFDRERPASVPSGLPVGGAL